MKRVKRRAWRRGWRRRWRTWWERRSRRRMRRKRRRRRRRRKWKGRWKICQVRCRGSRKRGGLDIWWKRWTRVKLPSDRGERCQTGGDEPIHRELGWGSGWHRVPRAPRRDRGHSAVRHLRPCVISREPRKKKQGNSAVSRRVFSPRAETAATTSASSLTVTPGNKLASER